MSRACESQVLRDVILCNSLCLGLLTAPRSSLYLVEVVKNPFTAGTLESDQQHSPGSTELTGATLLSGTAGSLLGEQQWPV